MTGQKQVWKFDIWLSRCIHSTHSFWNEETDKYFIKIAMHSPSAHFKANVSSCFHRFIYVLLLPIYGVLAIVKRIDLSTLNTTRIENIFYQFPFDVVKRKFCFKCHCISNWFCCWVEHSAQIPMENANSAKFLYSLWYPYLFCIRLISSAFGRLPLEFFNCVSDIIYQSSIHTHFQKVALYPKLLTAI